MERWKKLAAPLVVVGVVLIQFRAVLLGRVFRFEDIAGYFEPLWSAAAREMAAGRLPVWDGGAWSGQPLAGDPQIGIFYPPNWLWLALPVLRAYAVSATLHAAWGGLGMYALGRLRGRTRPAAVLAGIALAVGGFMVLQVRHIMFVQATAWLPWVIAAGWRVIGEPSEVNVPGPAPLFAPRSLRAVAALGAATGMLLLTGGVSMIYFGAWFAGALLLARVATVQRRGRALLRLAAGGVLGLALAAPMLWPMLAHARLSPRALGVDYHFASQFAWPHYGFLATLFVPNVFGDAAAGTWRGGFVQWELAGYYAGMLPFFLAAWWIARGSRERRIERITVAALCVFAILLAREGSLAHRAAYHLLPLFSATRCPARVLYVFSFAVPLLGADGFDALAARLPSSARGRFLGLGVALAALDLLVAHRVENPSLPLAEAQAASRIEATEFLAQHPGDRFVNDVHLDHALHNAGLTWGLDGASGYSSLPIWRYVHYLWIANHGAPYPHPRIHDDLSAQGLWRFSSPLVDALAVRFVIARDPPNGPGFTRCFAGSDGVAVWENHEALPRAWLARTLRPVADAAAAARAISEAAFDPRREAIVEGVEIKLDESNFLYRVSGVVSTGVEAPANGEVARIDLRSPTEMAIDLVAARAQPLVIAQPFYPGWSATLDGSPVAVVPADLALQAVLIPTAGRHQVVLRYRSAPVARGLTTGAVAFAALLVLALIRRRRR